MRIYVLFFISVLGVFMLNSCTHTPQKIEKYISKYCDLKKSNTCFIDLRKALKTDYDTMYVFNSATNGYKPQLDSRDDQYSIRMGVRYANKNNYKDMYYKAIVGPLIKQKK